MNTTKNISNGDEEPQPISQSEPAWLIIILDNAKKFHKKAKMVPNFIEIHQSLDRALLQAGGTDGHIAKALKAWIDINPTKHVSS